MKARNFISLYVSTKTFNKINNWETQSLRIRPDMYGKFMFREDERVKLVRIVTGKLKDRNMLFIRVTPFTPVLNDITVKILKVCRAELYSGGELVLKYGNERKRILHKGMGYYYTNPESVPFFDDDIVKDILIEDYMELSRQDKTPSSFDDLLDKHIELEKSKVKEDTASVNKDTEIKPEKECWIVSLFKKLFK